jgi:hypothetical protein
VSTPLIVPEHGRTELAGRKAPQESADVARDPSPSRHRFSGLLGLGLILLIVLFTLYLALRYMM